MQQETRPDWRVMEVDELWALVPPVDGRPALVAVDGRSGSGKTTFATRLATRPGVVLLHTDDIAWHHSFFDWHANLARHVLQPLRQGQAVAHRPQAWIDRGREGAMEVPAGATAVVVEGVSASHRRLDGLFDLALWVETDPREAHRRCVERDGIEELDFIAEWDAAEVPFLAADAPWRRADLLVDGDPRLPHDPARQVVVARPSWPQTTTPPSR
ncbi:uridine kinase family protein [Luteococcus peritonei]|uniref:Uridine kinase n=1 Tax=Luteococcus peritonei TaxID=88874 RepID=A0ABW4RUS0_9ACTN